MIIYGDGDGSYNGEGESTELVLNDQGHGQADVLITPRTRTKMHDIRRSGDFDSTDFNLSSIGWEIWGKFEVDGGIDSCVDLECLPRDYFVRVITMGKTPKLDHVIVIGWTPCPNGLLASSASCSYCLWNECSNDCQGYQCCIDICRPNCCISTSSTRHDDCRYIEKSEDE